MQHKNACLSRGISEARLLVIRSYVSSQVNLMMLWGKLGD